MEMTVKGFTITWPDESEHTEDQMRLAATYAVDALQSLTLGRVGGSVVTVMPRNCLRTERVPLGYTGPPFVPYMGFDGAVYNCTCSSGCSCPSQPYVLLPPPIGRIDLVTVDGEVLDASAYHVEDGRKLVRTDGEGWPACSGSDFTVTYLNAHPVGIVGNKAATILATEFLNALTGSKKCRLPSNVTGLTRQGVSMELTTGLFPGGMTGIREVDAFIRDWNPNNLTVAPTVHSPDLNRRARQVTWRA